MTKLPSLRRSVRRPPLGLILGSAAAALLTLVPVLYLQHQLRTIPFDTLLEVLVQARAGEVLWRSLGLAIVVAGFATALGLFTAWAAIRRPLKTRRLVHVLAMLPLAIPSYVAAYTWQQRWDVVRGLWGAALVLTTICAPIMHLALSAGLAQLRNDELEVARSLGWSPMTIALRLTFPTLRRHLSGGMLLVVLYVLSDFGVVAIMRFQTFTWSIYGAYRAGFRPNHAAALASLLVVAAIAIVLLEVLLRGRSVSALSSNDGSASHRTSWLSRCAAAAALAWCAISVGVPVGTSAEWSLGPARSGIEFGEFRDAIWNTLTLSTTGTALAVFLAFNVAAFAARYPSRWSHGLERASYVTHALPGIVFALAFVLVGTRWFRDWYQTRPMLIVAYAAIAVSMAVGPIRASIERLPRSVDEAGASLGWSPRRVFARAVLPATRTGVATGAALVALTLLKELPATLLLRPTETETVPTRIWNYAGLSSNGRVGPFALVLILIALLPTLYLALRPMRTRDDL